MRLEQFRYLIHIVEVGSFTKAATDLYISQQGLSHAIKQLEIELGVTLFDRSMNKITLTGAGEKVIEKAKEMLAIYDDLKTDLKPYINPAVQQIHVNELHVYSSPIISLTLLPTTLNFLYNKFPHLNIKIQEKSLAEIINKVIALSNSIGLVSLPIFEFEKLSELSDSKLIIEEIYRCKLMVCVAKSSGLASKSSISSADFIKHPLSIYNIEHKILDYVYGDSITPNIILNTTNLYLCRETIANGSAIGFTNNLVEKIFRNKQIEAIPFDVDIDMVFGHITSTDTLINPTTKEFLKILKKVSNSIS